MSWRSTDEWPDDKFVLAPGVIEESLTDVAGPVAPRPSGGGRRMRRLGKTVAVVMQIGLLLAMVLVPAGTFAGKPSSDPTAATTQTDAKGKSADAKATSDGTTKKADANAKAGASDQAKADADKTPPKKGTDPTTKGNGGSKGKSDGKGKSGDKGPQGNGKKTAATTETTVVAASGEPTITSNKADYPPGGTVVLIGTNWRGDEPSGVQITVNDDAGKSWSRGVIVDVGKDGTIKDQFRLPDWFVATYTVTATGIDSGRVAKTTFTDASIGTYDQCSNDLGLGYTTGNTDCRWINGNLNANNSTYAEGDSTVQRLVLGGLTAGSTHTVTFLYGTTKGGKHAYDYLTGWDYSEGYADLCDGISGCIGWPTIPAAIPPDLNAAFAAENPDVPQPAGRNFTVGNATAAAVTAGPAIASGSYAGDSEAAITLQFTVGSDSDACSSKGGTTTCSIGIWFGAHVALSTQWTSGGATAVPGSPYHVSLAAVDGSAIGQRDNQMQTGAIINPFNLIIIKTAVGGNDTFDYTVTGDGLNDFSLATVGGTATQTFADLTPGTADRSVTESAPPTGWSYTSLSCTETVNGPGTTTFSIDNSTRKVTVTQSGDGDTLTCTYTNTLQGSITIIKDVNPEPDTTDFSFTATGTGLSNFSLDDDGINTGLSGDIKNTVTFSGLEAGGNFTVTEDGETGYNLHNLVCTGLLAGDSGSNSTAGVVTIVGLAPGQSVECTYTNEKLPTIIVKKVTTGTAGGPFPFTTIGGNGFTTPFSLTTVTPGVAVQQSFQIGAAGIGGNFSVTEGTVPLGFVFTDAGCAVTVEGVAGTTTGQVPATRTGTITNLTAGTTVTCTFINSGALTTRTQGFWATHLSITQAVWEATGTTTVGGITFDGMTDADRTICDYPPLGEYGGTDVGPLTIKQVMGGFWSNIAKTTTGDPRIALDKARMQLLQQLLAAILNNQLFGSVPSGVSIDQAKAAYCGTDITAIRTAMSAMAAFNESGDSGLFTPGASADPKGAKAIAAKVYWDVLP